MLRLAALLHDIGKPATRRFEAGRRGQLPPPRGGRREAGPQAAAGAAVPEGVIDDVAELIYLHLRFHGYGTGAWTDSAVRRYVTDAGDAAAPAAQADPLGLHHPQPPQAAGAAAAYDELEERIARIAAEEDLARVRPDLDGNAIMELLGVPPGPLVGQAWPYLKELRLEQRPAGPGRRPRRRCWNGRPGRASIPPDASDADR